MTTTQIIDLIRQGTSPLTRKVALKIANKLSDLRLENNYLRESLVAEQKTRVALWLVEQENDRLIRALVRYRRPSRKFARNLRKGGSYALS